MGEYPNMFTTTATRQGGKGDSVNEKKKEGSELP